MSEIAERFRKRADAFETLIVGTAPERWASPSPCEGWLARDIVVHILEFSTWGIPSSVAKTLRDNAGMTTPPPSGVADDLAGAFRDLRAAVERVLDDPATPTDVVAYLDAALSLDLAQHWWDLARATGQDATMDPEEVDLLWSMLSPLPPIWWKWQVDNGHYAPAVPVSAQSPVQDRVLGLIGRDPRWTPPS